MAKLTPDEIHDLCEEHLLMAQRMAAKQMGAQGVDHAHVALWRALSVYDSDRGELMPFLGTKLRLLVMDLIREETGRKDTTRYKAERNQESITYHDADVTHAAPACDLDAASDLYEAFQYVKGNINAKTRQSRTICLLVGEYATEPVANIFGCCMGTAAQYLAGVAEPG